VPPAPAPHVTPTVEPTQVAVPPPPPLEITTTVPVQQDISPTLEKHQEVVRVEQETLEANLEQPRDTPSDTVNSIALSQKSLNMPLDNDIDEHVRTEILNAEPILTSVRTLDVSSIAADPNANIDPTLRNEMNFMQTWLEKAAATEVPFTPVLSKSQKKKLNKKTVDFQTKTRSQGHLPTSK